MGGLLTPGSDFNKVEQEVVKIKDTLEKQVKRGRESWNFIYFVFGILLTLTLFIIGIVDFPIIKKVITFFIIFIVLIWLCFLNGWFQNKLIGLKIKIEETWRKV